MDAAMFSPAASIVLINKVASRMGILRRFRNTIWFVLAGIGFALAWPFWRRKKLTERDEEADLVYDSDSPDDLEPDVRSLHPKREADTDIRPGESPKRARTEKLRLIEDELYCEYDSTWEDEDASTPKKSAKTKRFGRPVYNPVFARFKNAAKDMQNYRHNYPGNVDVGQYKRERMPNLMFYVGEIPSIPDGFFIGDFHRDWRGDYEKLERVHTFIQWLFPLQEPGLNYQAWELTKEEVKCFIGSDVARCNLLESYKLMLDFYGIELTNEKTGAVRRGLNWRERFSNLNRYTHNNLRITRILKCLGNLGFSHYQAPLVEFFLEETLNHGNLPRVKESVLNYFLFAVLDRTERKRLLKFAYQRYRPQDEFIWCPKIIQTGWSQQEERPHSSQQMGMNTRDNKSSSGKDQVWKHPASDPSIKARAQSEGEIRDEANAHFKSSSAVLGSNAGGLTRPSTWTESSYRFQQMEWKSLDDKGEPLRNMHSKGAMGMNTRDDKPSSGKDQVWKYPASEPSTEARLQSEGEIRDEVNARFKSSSAVLGSNAGGLTRPSTWTEGSHRHQQMEWKSLDNKREPLRNTHGEGAMEINTRDDKPSSGKDQVWKFPASDPSTNAGLQSEGETRDEASTPFFKSSSAVLGSNAGGLTWASTWTEGSYSHQQMEWKSLDNKREPHRNTHGEGAIATAFSHSTTKEIMEGQHNVLSTTNFFSSDAVSGHSSAPEQQQNDKAEHNEFMEMNLPLGGDSHTEKNMFGREEETTYVSQTCVYPNKGPSTNQNTEEDENEDEDL